LSRSFDRPGFDPDAIGKSILLDSVAHAVVGVMPEGLC
jgi:hypothetical protein